MGRGPVGELDLSSAPGGPASSPGGPASSAIGAGRETSSGASPSPAGGGAGLAPSRPLEFETRTAGGEDTF
jgi:hypothetical protein